METHRKTSGKIAFNKTAEAVAVAEAAATSMEIQIGDHATREGEREPPLDLHSVSSCSFSYRASVLCLSSLASFSSFPILHSPVDNVPLNPALFLSSPKQLLSQPE